jgi:hypothetical protein
MNDGWLWLVTTAALVLGGGVPGNPWVEGFLGGGVAGGLAYGSMAACCTKAKVVIESM